MKILMALMSLEIGGAETHVVELAKELNHRGHEILVASNGGAYTKELEVAGIRHVKIPMHRRNLYAMMKSLRQLRQLIRSETPDLVHAHARIPAFLCGILQRSMHFPLLTTAHGVFKVTPILRIMTCWGDRTVAISQDIRSYLMENYQVPSDLIHMTINGIDTELFRPMSPDQTVKQALNLGDGPVVALVSRLDDPSALAAESLIRIAPDLSREISGVEILVVGGGDQAPKLDKLAQSVNSRCGRTIVHMTGPRTDVAALLSLADVFVGVSRSALEAMSSGKPVILAGGEGYGGIFTADTMAAAQETNFCCRGNSAVTDKALLRDLIAVLCMPEAERQQLGQLGRKMVQKQYSVHRMAEDYLTVYWHLLHPDHPATAVISGYYGYGNLGDDAILLAISRQIAQLEQPIRLVVLSRSPRETTGKYGLRAVKRFSPIGIYRAVRNCDMLISGGGSLLQDKTSVRSLYYYLGIIRLAQRLQKPVFLWSNGIGPLCRSSSQEKVRNTLKTCDMITLRDEASLQTLRDLGLIQKDLIITEDPAFALQIPSQVQSRQRLKQIGIDWEQSIVGISVRPSEGMDRAVDEFAALGDRIVRELGRCVVFLVMQESEDGHVISKIQQKMQETSYIIKSPDHPEEMLGIIGCMDALISMRLHTIIFAAKARVPTLGCIYDPKVDAFLKRFNMPNCGTPQNIQAATALSALKDLLDHHETVRDRLDCQVREIEQGTDKAIGLFRQLLKTTVKKKIH